MVETCLFEHSYKGWMVESCSINKQHCRLTTVDPKSVLTVSLSKAIFSERLRELLSTVPFLRKWILVSCCGKLLIFLGVERDNCGYDPQLPPFYLNVTTSFPFCSWYYLQLPMAHKKYFKLLCWKLLNYSIYNNLIV